ncbi:hypothetical protein HDE78_004185 [Rhodanobacter sp. K2T2]|uniref:DUF4411 family protein n=1 Tax=Rhodanobacter sp. K2T2 TaxID=2723085 RepID=UPI0015CAEB5E|nr:DUF4411 family protein [Rhodanobacter sp. K2T2]NYE31201.1 hypothetical protein [Rhodanobacter sp. K2T2]
MATLYLLDANILINANRDYYPVEAVPEYWSWLANLAGQHIVKMPSETFDELKGGDAERDVLRGWANDAEVAPILRLPGTAEVGLVRRVLREYASDLTDIEVAEVGKDPFLIAHGLADVGTRVVVSAEISAPSKKRANRKVPDICKGLGIRCIDAFQMNRELQFRTDWNRR